MSALSCATRGVSTAVAARISNEAVGWAGWLGVTAIGEGGAEEA